MISSTAGKRILSSLAMLCLLVPLSRATAVPVHAGAICPAIGADTDCGVIITVTDTGATVAMTGQGPYDGTEDTLVGVVNSSSQPVAALGLVSGMTVFEFDGDGIDSYGAGGNGRDGSGYGGPNAYFSDIDPDLTSGTVNFVAPISAHGGTGYFSLEMAITAADPCSSVVNGGLHGPMLDGLDTIIKASFTPKKYDLARAASICGFKTFNWQQTIDELPMPSPYKAAGSDVPLTTPPPFLDPPPGGWAYDDPPVDANPFYYSLTADKSNKLSLAYNQTATTLSYFDMPIDPCLPGGNGEGCKGETAEPGSKLAFTTHLVGVTKDNKPQNLKISFTWTDTFNGSTGGIHLRSSRQQVTPGSGTGGITITSVNDVTDYQFQGIGVTTVNGVAVSSGDSTPPKITPSIVGTLGTNGWYVSDVGVQWNVVDPESPVTATSGCGPTTITTDTAGTMLSCSATSAGGTSSRSVTIKRDATPPLVMYGVHPSIYTIDQQVSISCVPSDNLSGVASSTCRPINGPAWSFGPGSHTFSAAAVDQAGNTGGGSTTFTVMATFGSQCALSRVFDTSPTQAMGMCTVLGYAQAAANRGDAKLKQTYITSYLNIVKVALAESYLTANQGAVLTQFANTL